MTSLEDELSEANKPRMSDCSVCVWLNNLPDDEQATWDRWMARTQKECTHASLYAVSHKHDATIGLAAIVKHRNQGHRR